MLKTISYKIVLLLLIVTGLNFVYKWTFYEKDIRSQSTCVYTCSHLPAKYDIIYLGESSNFTVDSDDSTQKYISELVQYYLPEIRLFTIDTPAVHAGIYKSWIEQMKNNKPGGLVITMNLRSFGASWIYSKLETNLIRSVRLVQPFPAIYNRFTLSLKNFSDLTVNEREQKMLNEWANKSLKFPYEFKYKTVREWDDAMANGGWVKEDGSWDMPKIELAAHFIKNYAFNIDESNPRVKDFDEITEWGHKNNVKIYYNILAENVKLADSLVGKDLVFLMRNNRDYLVNRYTKLGAVVVDNLESANWTDFLDKNWPTEHYNYKGRMAVAKKIAETIKRK